MKLVCDVEGRASSSGWDVDLVPLLLSVASCVIAQGLLILELHDECVSTISLGFDGFDPNAGDAIELFLEIYHAIKGGLDFVFADSILPGNRYDVNYGFRSGIVFVMLCGSGSDAKCECGDSEKRENKFFHSRRISLGISGQRLARLKGKRGLLQDDC